MASSSSNLAILATIVTTIAMLSFGAMAQAPSASTNSSTCTNAIMSLSPCLPYVTGNSTSPSAPCCSQLGTFVQSTPQCLCTLVNSRGSPSFLTVNQTLALALPGACKLQTPPISQCKAPGSSVTSSSPGPTDSSTDTPEASAAAPTEVPASSSGGGDGATGSKTAGTSSSDAAIVTASLVQALLVGLFAVAGAGF
ncbi:Non-specific lipid transfer protein GPI-anchored 15 [Linum perenne]